MKTFAAALSSQYASATTTLALAWRVTRRDGVVFGLTDHDRDLALDGVVYQAAGGLNTTSVDSAVDFEGDTLDVAAFLGANAEAELESGDWDDAEILIFEYHWASPPSTLTPQSVNILRRGHLGEVQRTQGQLRAEILGLVQRLRTRIGVMLSASCRYRFGDAFCTKPLGPLTFPGTLTGVGSEPHLVAMDTTLTVADGRLNFGEILFLSGRNAGRQMDIRTWNDQVLRLMRPLPFPMAAGDQYRAIQGCDKRFQTCHTLYNNAINFGGEPHVPGVDKLHANDIQDAPLPPRPPTPDGNPDNVPDSGGSDTEGTAAVDAGGASFLARLGRRNGRRH